ncbi:uncharacterized protein MYCFIDRAFT_180382 [Pseudocercospora fijiensis CIRAD86]|uniref:Uncharacterized protein n=1 Tax=Pseudocercospora fijiensis (strain CIRAD86) TaxID=383855 RepID=M2YGV8_PSEFD|nr:uncharacterized protein MYCFIDRAFT_180382 [Pseudocercospora fijiensis CIRAD86]EME77050.1 hypothetical protein MYCFIDRAFT_180382 [Pseudocercospora fijiensis CIRAD86]
MSYFPTNTDLLMFLRRYQTALEASRTGSHMPVPLVVTAEELSLSRGGMDERAVVRGGWQSEVARLPGQEMMNLEDSSEDKALEADTSVAASGTLGRASSFMASLRSLPPLALPPPTSLPARPLLQSPQESAYLRGTTPDLSATASPASDAVDDIVTHGPALLIDMNGLGPRDQGWWPIWASNLVELLGKGVALGLTTHQVYGASPALLRKDWMPFLTYLGPLLAKVAPALYDQMNRGNPRVKPHTTRAKPVTGHTLNLLDIRRPCLCPFYAPSTTEPIPTICADCQNSNATPGREGHRPRQDSLDKDIDADKERAKAGAAICKTVDGQHPESLLRIRYEPQAYDRLRQVTNQLSRTLLDNRQSQQPPLPALGDNASKMRIPKRATTFFHPSHIIPSGTRIQSSQEYSGQHYCQARIRYPAKTPEDEQRPRNSPPQHDYLNGGHVVFERATFFHIKNQPTTMNNCPAIERIRKIDVSKNGTMEDFLKQKSSRRKGKSIITTAKDLF